MAESSEKFAEVNAKQSFPQMEKEVLKFWDEENIFEQSVLKRKSGKKYVFFDGPPFANGLPHYGHILANALKDAITRYWTMKGYYVPRTNGWDCHGLPVEYEMEKELEISGKKDIEKYGINKFNQKCRDSVFRYTEEWEKLFKRIGRWVDFGETYATLENDYMESIWWVFKQIWEKDMVYQGHKSMHICPRCETPLSNFEVSQGYKDVTDLSVTVVFKLKDEPEVGILAWTTTPWTLPGNIALALGKDIDYVKFELENFPNIKNGIYISSKAYYDNNFSKIPEIKDSGGNPTAKVIEKVNAKDLEGKEYEPIFPFYKGKLAKKAWVILLEDFVSTEDGTGVVHIAPAFGEDDLNAGLKNDLEVLQHVNVDGTFKKEVEPWAGKFVKGQDQNISDWLANEGLLFYKENYRHSYPHCWRCDTPLLNYSTKAWFIKVKSIKEKLLRNNKKIHWQPEHIKEGRFGKWLENVRDWNVSRNRFWGCPIPIWKCKKCDHQTCIGSIKDLKSRAIDGKMPERNGELDLHKPYIDEVELKCKECNGNMQRIPEVLDCWFESGSMPYAQLHYPFENKEEFEKNFPAQFIAEGLDQTRGWFYTLHVLSTILFDKPAFENVIVNGILLAADGEKLSKRKKNYPDPTMLFDTRGVDSLRFFLYSSTSPLGEDVRFSESHVDEVIKKTLLTLWNSYSFFVTYANIDNWSPEKIQKDFKPKHKLDQWILSELNNLIEVSTKYLDEYNLTFGTRPMIEFLDNLSNWYIRRSRRRFWKSENDNDKDEAYQTLYTLLIEFCKLIAPFAPFISDEVYRNLSMNGKYGEESVHLCDWPKSEKQYIQPHLNDEIGLVRKIVTLGHSLRAQNNIKVRQPLTRVEIALPENIDRNILSEQVDVIAEELNVKFIEIVEEIEGVVAKNVKPDAKKLGPKYGKDVQTIIQKAKNNEYQELTDGRIKIDNFILEKDEFEIGFEGLEGYDAQGEDGIVVILDTTITPELKFEGYAREIVRSVQDLRKKAEYEVNDRIYLQIKSQGEIENTVTMFADYIKSETLAIELIQSGDFIWDKEEKLDIEGNEVIIAIKKK